MREKKLLSPAPYTFTTKMTVQIGDINYGGHVGNERYLVFAQESRMRFLDTFGYSEINFGPYGLVVAEAGIEYFAELFHGDIISISISINNISKAAFDCYYKIETTKKDKTIIAALVKTSMVCYDYKERKVKSIPDDVRMKLTS